MEAGKYGVPFPDAKVTRIAALTAVEQLEEVRRELKKRNPKYDGSFTQVIEDDVVVALVLKTNQVADISPVRALTKLRKLEVHAASDAPGILSNLWPIKGMGISELWVGNNRISDLQPLKGMPLKDLQLDRNPVTDVSVLKELPLKHLWIHGISISDLKGLEGLKLESLECSGLPITDLSPLKGMPLKGLTVHATSVSDLSPLKGMQLEQLNLHRTKVQDLSPLKGMPLRTLHLVETEVTDLSPIRDAPLKSLFGDFKPARDAKILRETTMLEVINNKPVAEFWKDF